MSPRVVTVSRIKGHAAPLDSPTLAMTPEQRMSAVWKLTLECLAWLPEPHEPRLQRSVVRVLRPRR